MAKVLTEKSNYEDIADAIREKNGTGETYLPSEMAGAIRSIHGDVTGVKGDSESNYRTGNVNLTPANVGAKATQTPVASPSASGTAVAFIESISQNAQGVITPTKKTVRTATASQSGLMSAADKVNLDDLKTRMTAAEDEMDILAIYPTASGKGAMVTIEGTVDAPPAEMVIYGKSVQDGTPTPSAPVAIVTAGENESIEMRSTNGSLFDPAFLLGASGWSVNGNVYSGDAYALWQQFNNNHWIPHVPSGTRLTIYGRASIPSAVSYPRFVFNYTDGTTSNVNLTAVSEFVIFSDTSEVGKDVDYVTFTYSDNTSATMSLADLRISIGTTDSGRDYIAPAVSDIPTEPNGLPGIPVASGENYTDTGGQRWLCDTIDLEAGVWVKRVGIFTLNGENIPQTVSTIGSCTRFWYQVGTVSIAPASGTMCSHAPYDASGYDEARLGFGISASYPRNIWAKLPTATVGSTAETIRTWMQNNPMTLVAALVEPVVEPLTEAQIAALRALRGRKGLTNLYSADPVGPEFRAEMYIDIPTYIQSVIKKPLSLYDLNITPGTWNNIHPDFDPETEEYAVTLRKGNAATVNAVVIGTTVTVTFDTIGGARTYFTMRTSSSAVGDRKTYSCEVNPYDAGVGGGLVMTVTKGNLSRRYYLSITSVE